MNNIRNISCCILIRNEHIVMIRKLNPKYITYNQLILPGGHIEFSENSIDACKREVYEETGLQTSDLNLVGILEFVLEAKNYHAICFVYYASCLYGELMTREPEKQTCEWVEINEIENNSKIPDYFRSLILDILKENRPFSQKIISLNNDNVLSWF